MRSLERLIRLARRTGDRLIVHDSDTAEDIVIMDLDAYERLVDSEADGMNFGFNMDGGISYDEDGESEFSEEAEEDDMPWDRAAGDSDWYRAGEVLEDRTAAVSLSDLPQIDRTRVSPFDHEWYGDESASGISADHSDGVFEEKLSDDEPVFYEEPL